MKSAVVLLAVLLAVLTAAGCGAQPGESAAGAAAGPAPQQTAAPAVPTNTPFMTYEYELFFLFDYNRYPDRTRFSLEDAEGFEPLIDEIKKVDPTFDTSGYYVWINLYSDGKSGTIMFQYYIGGIIQTNKSYLFSIGSKRIEKLLYTSRPFPADREAHEQMLLQKVKDFQATYEPEEIDMTNVIEIREKYTYSYDTDELRYVRFTPRSVEGVITDDATEIIIE